MFNCKQNTSSCGNGQRRQCLEGTRSSAWPQAQDADPPIPQDQASVNSPQPTYFCENFPNCFLRSRTSYDEQELPMPREYYLSLTEEQFNPERELEEISRRAYEEQHMSDFETTGFPATLDYYGPLLSEELFDPRKELERERRSYNERNISNFATEGLLRNNYYSRPNEELFNPRRELEQTRKRVFSDDNIGNSAKEEFSHSNTVECRQGNPTAAVRLSSDCINRVNAATVSLVEQ